MIFYLPAAPENAGTIGTIAIQSIGAKTKFGHLPQLLNAITEEEALHLLRDADYVMQEKHDGERRMARRERQQIHTSNRKGELIPTAQEIAVGLSDELRCVVDGEHVGGIFIIFDMLEYNGQPTSKLPYLFRLQSLENVPSSETVQIVTTAHTTEEKTALFESLRAAGKEGVVFKHRNAPYSAGRPNSGGDQLKFKFYATATCQVRNVNEQRSVEVELRDGDQFLSKGNVTIPPNKAIPAIGQLIEVRYLYAYPGEGSLYQPTFLGLRDDVDCDDVSSLKYKAANVEFLIKMPNNTRSSSGKTPQEIAKIKKAFDEKRKTAKKGAQVPISFTPPNYDAEYWAAIEKMEEIARSNA